MGDGIKLCHEVQVVVGLLEDGLIDDHERRALLDALGHDDCVPREHRGCHWEHEAQRYAGNADYWRDRAERAERERDALSADNDRLREALSVMDEFVIAAYVEADEDWWEEYNTARAALSADADADAEPEPAEYPERDCPGCRDGDCGLHGPPDCGAPHWAGMTTPCVKAVGHTGRHQGFDSAGWLWQWTRTSEGAEPSPAEGEKQSDPALESNRLTDAAGGRPREADPQGDSPSTAASVDGGGDDGRSRAIEAAFQGIPTQYVESESMRRKIAEGCVDDALASGGVVTRERYERLTASLLAVVQDAADRMEGGTNG